MALTDEGPAEEGGLSTETDSEDRRDTPGSFRGEGDGRAVQARVFCSATEVEGF